MGTNTTSSEDMRLLFVCPALKPGGAEHHWLGLLPALRDRGFAVRVLCLRELGAIGEQLRDAGVRVDSADASGPLDTRALTEAVRVGVRARPDVVVSMGTLGDIVARRVARRLGVPNVVNDHRGPGLRASPREEVARRVVAPGADRVIAICTQQRDDLLRVGHPEDRITFIPNGVDAPATSASREVTRAALGVADDETMVLCVAGLRREKRIDLFCDAIRRLHDDGVRVRGFVAGDGPRRDDLAEPARRADVTLLGRREDVGDLLLACDVTCSPSDVEAMSLSILESFALGRPVVATAVGGTPDLVTAGVTGLLTARGDASGLASAIGALAEQDELRHAMGDRARALHTERFTHATMVDAYATELLAVAGHPGFGSASSQAATASAA